MTQIILPWDYAPIGNFFVDSLLLLGTFFLPLNILVYLGVVLIDAETPFPAHILHMGSMPLPIKFSWFLLFYFFVITPITNISHSTNICSAFVIIILWPDCIVTLVLFLCMIELNTQCISAYITTLHLALNPIAVDQCRQAVLFIAAIFIHRVHRSLKTTMNYFSHLQVVTPPFKFTFNFDFASLRSFLYEPTSFIIGNNFRCSHLIYSFYALFLESFGDKKFIFIHFHNM